MHATRALLAVLAALTMVTPRATAQPATQYGGSQIWAGIIDQGAGITAANLQLVVPHVTALCGGDVAVWVGIGGWDQARFAQLGITATSTSVGAWYELFDANGDGPEVDVPLAARPGDLVHLWLRFAADHSTLTLAWRNDTTGQTVRRTVTPAARYWGGSTAEWIVERHLAALADFGTIAMQSAHYTAAGRTVPMNPAGYVEDVIDTSADDATRTAVVGSNAARVKWLACG